MNNLKQFNNTFESYQQLINLFENNKKKFLDNISISISGFFAANMCASLGAVLDILTENLNSIDLKIAGNTTESILKKNDFLTYYGKQREVDVNNTTIKFQKLKTTDGKYFKNYVINEFIEGHSRDLPKMTLGVKEKMIEAIYEIFVNAQIHSETNFIYTCGQFFPNKNTIEFTIVDVGIGFKEKVNSRFNKNLSSVQAIKWAVQDKKTTKIGISGGIGLAVLKEFVVMNCGKMQIISKDGFYEYSNKGEIINTFIGEFPGTIVNLQFKTNDMNNYLLKSEIDINDIF
jgi:hypothetical protein